MAAAGDADRPLPNVRHERFCRLFIFGNPKHDPDDERSEPETRGNATKSYEQAGYKSRGAAASVSASRLLKDARIQGRIVELRALEQRIASTYVRNWRTLVPDAQRVLLRAMAGEDVSSQAVTAAREVIEQAHGPTRFRFGVQKDADRDGGLNIVLWSGSSREE